MVGLALMEDFSLVDLKVNSPFLVAKLSNPVVRRDLLSVHIVELQVFHERVEIW